MAKQLSTEDQALNMIAREAEARLAAKRAARAEARSIRMKELEKAQQQADETAEKEIEQSGDEKVQRKKSIAASKLATVATGMLDDEKPVSDPSLSSVVASQGEEYMHLRENIRLLDVKYRKAMVSMAQLDNERQALQYTVECLKDQVEDQVELTENLKDELDHKNREYNKLSIEHRNIVAELNQMRIVLQDRERILDEHGINLDGTLKEEPKADESMDEIHQDVHTNGFADDEERETLLDQIKSLKEEVAQLRKDSAEEESRVVRGKRSNDASHRSSHKDVVRFELQIKTLEEEEAELLKQITKLESNARTLKQTVESSDSTQKSMSAEIKKMRSELHQSQEEADKLELTRDSLERQCARALRAMKPSERTMFL